MWHSVTSSKSHRFWKLPNIFQKPSARILNVCQIIGANRPQVACQDASRCMCRSDKGMGTYVNLQEIWTMIPKQHSLETLQVGTAHFSHTQHVFAYSKSLNLWTYHKSLHSIQNWHITNPKGTLEVQEMVCQTTEALTRSHRPKLTSSTQSAGTFHCCARASQRNLRQSRISFRHWETSRDFGISRFWRHFPWNCQQKWKVLPLDCWMMICISNFVTISIIVWSISSLWLWFFPVMLISLEVGCPFHGVSSLGGPGP